MINQDSPTMRNTYTRTALALLFMRGSTINDWVLQQTEKLYLKCNGDLVNGWPRLTKWMTRDCGWNSVSISDAPSPTRPPNNGHMGSWPIALWVARQLM